MYTIQCSTCHRLHDKSHYHGQCMWCGGTLQFHYELKRVSLDDSHSSMWRYRELLPVDAPDHIVTLGEGNTPLVPSKMAFNAEVRWKDETRNPTGSMKDRALSIALTKAHELGKTHSIICSTGNAGISAAAYSARADVHNAVLIPHDTATERFIAMRMFGSKVFGMNASIESLKDIVNRITEEYGWINTSTYAKANPYQAEGPKTIAYEIYEQLQASPDYLVVPVGGAGTLAGIWRGLHDMVSLGWTTKLPKLIAVHHADYNSLEIALARNLQTDAELLKLGEELDLHRPTVARNIQHTYCFDGVQALQALRQSGGRVASVSDPEILLAQRELAEIDGIFAEPSSASVVAAIRQLSQAQYFKSGDVVVGLISGSGFRETASVPRLDQGMQVLDTDNYLTQLTELVNGIA